MKLIMFSKGLAGRTVGELRDAGLEVPMVTGNFDLLSASHPTARPILGAMRSAGVGLLKLGYFKYEPGALPYLEEVHRVRDELAAWQAPAREVGVTVCYHTHSNRCMGLNCAAMAHLLDGLDPSCIGAYIDLGHLLIEGEEFALGVAMVAEYLRVVAVKDVAIVRVEKGGHGSAAARWVEAGRGMVDWTDVFARLAEANYDGPVSVHCEFEVPKEEFLEAARREVAFFRKYVTR